MNETWQRIEIWLKENAPKVLESLQPGATDQEIKETEEFLGITFPDDFKESYKIHNGQIYGLYISFIQGNNLLSLHEITEQWKVWKELVDGGEFDDIKSQPTGPIKDDWYNLKWIPVTHNGGGDHLCIDFAPDNGGETGQIISFWHDWESRTIEALSFGQLLNNFANSLENNEYTVSDKYGLEI